MDPKTITPILITLGGLGVGYFIYRRLSESPHYLPPAAGAPSVLAPTKPGISTSYGKFNLNIPLTGISDLISGIRGGGTKEKAKVETTATAPSLVNPLEPPVLRPTTSGLQYPVYGRGLRFP